MTSHSTGADASTASAEPQALSAPPVAAAAEATVAPPEAPGASREHIRHLLFGTNIAVQTTIRQLHKLGYAEPNDWSRPIATGKAGEVMSILTKRVV